MRRFLSLAGAAAAAAMVAIVLAWATTREDVAGGAETSAYVRRSADQNILLITIDSLRADAPGTPTVDRLAANGLRFTFAHAQAVLTLPSAATILTGRYPFEHKVRANTGTRLGPGPATVAEAARSRGLATAAFVGSATLGPRSGLTRGFQQYDAAEVDRGPLQNVAAARVWIGERSTPWLAWVHLRGAAASVDASLAPLIETVERDARPTTVILTGARGEAVGGRLVYEPALRVPLVLAQVGGGSAAPRRGMTSDAPVAHIDIAPTVATLLELGVPRDAPGQTLLEAEATRDRASYFEAGSARGVILRKYKLIAARPVELYDLGSDPAERRNLAESEPEVRKELEDRLASFDSMTTVIRRPSAPRLPSVYATAR